MPAPAPAKTDEEPKDDERLRRDASGWSALPARPPLPESASDAGGDEGSSGGTAGARIWGTSERQHCHRRGNHGLRGYQGPHSRNGRPSLGKVHGTAQASALSSAVPVHLQPTVSGSTNLDVTSGRRSNRTGVPGLATQTQETPGQASGGVGCGAAHQSHLPLSSTCKLRGQPPLEPRRGCG